MRHGQHGLDRRRTQLHDFGRAPLAHDLTTSFSLCWKRDREGPIRSFARLYPVFDSVGEIRRLLPCVCLLD